MVRNRPRAVSSKRRPLRRNRGGLFLPPGRNDCFAPYCMAHGSWTLREGLAPSPTCQSAARWYPSIRDVAGVPDWGLSGNRSGKVIASPPWPVAEGGFFMSHQHPDRAHRVPDPLTSGVIEFAALNAEAEFAFDLLVIEAGLRLKVLPFREALKRGAERALNRHERQCRRSCLARLCRHSPLTIVDEGLFADAVARRPAQAERMAKALRRGPWGRDAGRAVFRAGL